MQEKKVLASIAAIPTFRLVLGGTAALRLPFGAGGSHFFCRERSRAILRVRSLHRAATSKGCSWAKAAGNVGQASSLSRMEAMRAVAVGDLPGRVPGLSLHVAVWFCSPWFHPGQASSQRCSA